MLPFVVKVENQKSRSNVSLLLLYLLHLERINNTPVSFDTANSPLL